MSNDLAAFAGGVPLLRDGSTALAILSQNMEGEKLSLFDIPSVKCPTSGAAFFTIDTASGPKAATALDVVILSATPKRSYWENRDPDGSPPVCYSDDMVRGVGEPGGECALCPLNAPGSKADSEWGRACREFRYLLCLIEGRTMPVIVRVPPSSVSDYRKYLPTLDVPLSAAITRIGLRPDKNPSGTAYSRFTFSCVGQVPEGYHERIAEVRKIFSTALRRS